MNPDYTASKGAVWSEHILFAFILKVVLSSFEYMQQT